MRIIFHPSGSIQHPSLTVYFVVQCTASKHDDMEPCRLNRTLQCQRPPVVRAFTGCEEKAADGRKLRSFVEHGMSSCLRNNLVISFRSDLCITCLAHP
ncbi:hypothetical protein RvY_13058-3 [Ramazzottius varieornatus]|uniref:Uncharacterized protein n=1 Tax=Ramazzottius varieornatus TaxID=947166 RepID=A0A1D1VLL1_RAMVA|nr:hypothetical protein RvY_13058-3 [Ramazzottius varieornatus]